MKTIFIELIACAGLGALCAICDVTLQPFTVLPLFGLAFIWPIAYNSLNAHSWINKTREESPLSKALFRTLKSALTGGAAGAALAILCAVLPEWTGVKFAVCIFAFILPFSIYLKVEQIARLAEHFSDKNVLNN